VDHHHAQPGAREVSRVVLSGEGALIPGLDSYLGGLLGLPTDLASPVQRLASNRSNVSDEQLRAMEPVLAVALGLAMEEA
jgi:type IV pilus assembly protein PilM